MSVEFENEPPPPETTSATTGDAPELLDPRRSLGERSVPANLGRLESISDATQERITVGPAPDWVLEQEYDAATNANSQDRCDMLLLDRQAHAERQQIYQRSAQRLETMQAVLGAGQWTVEIDPSTQWLAIHSVKLRRGAEGIEQAKVEKLRLRHREDGLENLVLSRSVTVVLVLEDLRLGDILESSFTITTHKLLLPERFQYFAQARLAVPLRFFHFRVLFPAGSAMQWKTPRTSMVPAIREPEGMTEWRWELRDLQPPVNEQRVPSSVFSAPWIQVSNFASWAELAHAVHAAWPECFEGEELQRQAQTIASAEPTLLGRATRALRFVQDEIRYLSDDLELGGMIPSNPDAVLRRRFGDCKDKSFLLVHLLRSLGIPARAWLANTVLDERLRTLLPANLFNHAVVEYEIEGQRRWAEATRSMQGGDALHRAAPYFRIGLPIGPESQGLEALPLPAVTGGSKLTEHFRLDTARRRVSLLVTTVATGSEADMWRQYRMDHGIHGIAAFFAKQYGDIFRGAERIGEFAWRDDRENNVVEMAEAYTLPHFLYRRPRDYVVGHRAYRIQAVIGLPSDSPTRKFSLALPYPCQREHHILFEFPKFQARPGSVEREQNAFFNFSVEHKREAGLWSEHFRVETVAPIVAAKDYPTFRERVLVVWRYTDLMHALPEGIRIEPWTAEAVVLPAKAASPEKPPAPATESSSTLAPAVSALLTGQAVPASPETPLPLLHLPSEQLKINRTKAVANGVQRPSIQVSDSGEPTGSAAFNPVRVSRRRRSKSRDSGIDPVWRFVPFVAIVVARVIFTLLRHR